MQQFKENLENQISSKHYRGWEKLEHETQMRLKAWSLEQGIYHAPGIVLLVSYFIWGMMQEINLPFGQSYEFFDKWFFIWLTFGVGLNTLSLIFFKPIFSQVMDKQVKEISEDVYLKGARFTTTAEFNQDINQYLQAEYEVEKNSKVFESFEIPLQQLTDVKDKRFEAEPQDINIPRISLATGLCIMGSPGKGKSVLINRIIDQIPNDALHKNCNHRC